MKVYHGFKMVLCGALIGLLIGLVFAAFPRRPFSPRVAPQKEDKESASAKGGMAGNRTNLFQQLLKPYLTKLRATGSLPPADIFEFRTIVATWLCADTASCADFLNSAGMAVLLRSDSDSLLSSAAMDARSVLEEAGRLPTPELRDSFLRTAIPQLAEKNPAEALKATHSLPRWVVTPVQKRVAEIWVKKDLKRALQAYFDDQNIDHTDVFRHTIRTAAKEDFEQAFELINSWPSTSFQRVLPKDSALLSVIASIDKETDPKLLRAQLQKLPESSRARKDGIKRLDLIEMERGSAALPEIANHWSAIQVEEIAVRANYSTKSVAEIKDILDQIPGIRARSEACKLIAYYHAKKAPEETMKWAATIPEGPIRAAAFSESFKEWMSTAPEKAITYALIDGNPDTATRRQLNLELLDWAYSETLDFNKDKLAEGFSQLSPEQQAQVKKQIASTFDTVAANKILMLLQR